MRATVEINVVSMLVSVIIGAIIYQTKVSEQDFHTNRNFPLSSVDLFYKIESHKTLGSNLKSYPFLISPALSTPAF